MRINKLISVFLIFALCFSLTACRDSSKERDDNNSSLINNVNSNKDQNKTMKSGDATPLLYKVTDDDGDVIWLFGSIHVGEEYFYPLPDYVFDALDNADSLAVEFDIVAFEKDNKAQMKSIESMVIKTGKKTKDLLDEELYKEAKEILKDCGYYSSYMNYYLPILWADFIDSALYEEIDANSDLGIDRHLIDYAYENDIDVLSVESAEFQYGMMAGFSEELQAFLLEQSIEQYNSKMFTKLSLSILTKAWARGNEEKLISLLSDSDTDDMDKEEKKLYEEYNNAMIVERNENMTDWAEEALEDGEEVFICVGAAHVVGPGAMAEMLSDRGYTVEIVN